MPETPRMTIPSEPEPAEAEATAPPGAAPPVASRGAGAYDLELPVDFGTYSNNGDTPAITCSCGRAGEDGQVGIRAATAEQWLVGTQLDVALREGGDQESLEGMEPQPIYGIAEVAGFSVRPRKISFRLKFPIDGQRDSRLARLAGKEGVLLASLAGEHRGGSAGGTGTFEGDDPEAEDAADDDATKQAA